MGNPALVYGAVWGGVLLLYFFNATSNLVPISYTGLGLILLNILSMAFLCIVLAVGRKNGSVTCQQVMVYEHSARVYMRTLLAIWFLGTLFEIYVQRGFPLYWKFIGDGRIYTDFGIPSFHGVMNAMYLQAVTALAYLYFVKPRKLYIYILILLLFWPVLMLGRGILLSALIQIVAVYFMMRRLRWSALIFLFFSAIGAVFLFGYVGDLRQSENPFFHLVRPEYVDFFSSLPSGFLWFYVYLTSGLSNLFYNVDVLQPAYAFDHTFYNLLPNALKLWMGLEQRKDLFLLVDDGLNASTFYAAYISDFGIIGAFFIVFFVQLCCCIAYSVARSGRPWGILAYAVALQVLMFSVFYDLFFILPVLMQFFLALTYFLFSSFRIARRG